MQIQHGPQTGIHTLVFQSVALLLPPPFLFTIAGLVFPASPAARLSPSDYVHVCGRTECVLFSQPHWGTGDIKAHCVSVSSLSPFPWCPRVLASLPAELSHCAHILHSWHARALVRVWLHYYVISPRYTTGNPEVQHLAAFFLSFQLLTLKTSRPLPPEVHHCEKRPFHLWWWIFNCHTFHMQCMKWQSACCPFCCS